MPKSDPAVQARSPSSWVLEVALAVGVLSVSSAAILIKLVPSTPAATAFWRLLLSVLILLPWALKGQARSPVTIRNLPSLIFSGIFLALHFLTWIWSLHLTSVAVSTALVSTHPVFVALYERFFLKRSLKRETVTGGILIFVGLILATVGHGIQIRHLEGILMALLGSLFAAGYILLGQRLRQRLTTATYAVSVYSTSTLLLGLMQLGWYGNLGTLSPRIFVIYLLLALLPTLGGHTLFNWLLRYTPATTVSLAFLGEIAGATLLAWVILGQVPSAASLFAVLFILAGLTISVRPPKILTARSSSKT